MKSPIALLVLIISTFVSVSQASLSPSCSQKAVAIARYMASFDSTFEDLKQQTVTVDEENLNILWIILESGSDHYPNLFTYTVEVRNPDQDSCLLIKAELVDVDGAKP